jgi:hypothetical protein
MVCLKMLISSGCYAEGVGRKVTAAMLQELVLLILVAPESQLLVSSLHENSPRKFGEPKIFFHESVRNVIKQYAAIYSFVSELGLQPNRGRKLGQCTARLP